MNRSLLAVACALGLTSVVLADTVTLTNGAQLHGKVVGETATTIRLKTGGGVMELARDKVRSIETNDKGTGSPKPAPRPDPKPADDPEPTPDDPQPDPEPAAGDDATLRQELEALGPSAEQRLDAVALKGDERKVLEGHLAQMGRTTRRGANAHQLRENARDQLVRDFGPKAIGPLADELTAANYWRTRGAVEALEQIVNSDPATGRWLAYHHDIPTALIKLLDHKSDAGLSPALRSAAAQALSVVTGQTLPYPASQEQTPTAEERRAQTEWRTWWRTGKRDWQKLERDNEMRRKELREQLKSGD